MKTHCDRCARITMRHVTDSSGRTYCMDCAWVIYRTLYREEPAEAPAPVVRPARAVRLRE